MQKRIDPLLTYRERMPQVRRTFQLYGDRVEIDARWTLGQRYHSVVRLAELSPRMGTFTVRNKWFRKSVLVGSIAAGAGMLLTTYPFFRPVHLVAPLCWVATAVAAAVAVLSFRKRQFAHFPRKDGRPGLDLCRTDPAPFDAFLSEVQARIRKA